MWPRVFIGLCKKKGRRKKKKCGESLLLSAVYLSELIQVDVPLSAGARVCVCVVEASDETQPAASGHVEERCEQGKGGKRSAAM